MVHALEEYITGRPPEKVRGYVLAPTGAGKTVLFTRLLEDLRTSGTDCNAIIVVPTKQLVGQTQRALIKHGFQGKVNIASGQVRDTGEATVMITTNATFARQLKDDKKFGINPENYQLVIFDEAHHLQGESSHRALKTRLPHAMWIGFTATDDYDKKRRLSYILPDKVFEITPHEAIDEGLNAPYNVAHLRTHADLSTVRVLKNDYDQDDLNRVIDVDERNLAIARFGATCLGEVRTLYNCSRVHHAENIAEALRLHGVKAMAIHGGMHKDDQEAILAALHRGDIMAVAQAKIIGEGFDEPRIEAVVNISPTRSKVRAKQRNRAGRTDEDNPGKVALVIECVDDNYNLPPLLFNDDELAGDWSYAPHGTSSLAARDWNLKFAGYNDAGIVVETRLVDDDILAASSSSVQLQGFSSVSIDDIQPLLIKPTVEPLESQQRKPRIKNVKPQTLTEYETAQKRRSKPQKVTASGDDEDDFRAYLAAVDDYHEMFGEIHTPDAFIDSQRDDGVRVVAQFLFGANVRKPIDEIARGLVERVPNATKNALSEILTNKSIKDSVDPERLSEVQAALREASHQGRTTPSASSVILGVVDAARPKWSSRGQCNGLGPDRFMPGRGESTTPAKEKCTQCDVAGVCLRYALENGEKFGVWGGASERERRRIRKVITTVKKGNNVSGATMKNLKGFRDVAVEIMTEQFGFDTVKALVEGVEVKIK